MKYLSFIICAVIFTVCLNGCASEQEKFNALRDSQKKRQTFSESQNAELAELAVKPVRTTVGVSQEQTRMEKDNSVVETMYDAFGNKTESRVFYNDAPLKMVVVRTSVNGQKEVLVYGQNGEVKTAPPTLLDRALTFAAREIAKAAQIFEGRRENEMLVRLQTAEMPPTEDFQSLDVKPANVAELAPVAEAEPTVETVAPSQPNQTEPTTTEDSSSKLRAAAQSLKIVRPKLTSKDSTAGTN